MPPDHPSLFLSCNRFKDGRHQGLKDWTVAFIVKHYAKLAGLKHFSPHRWRHTSISAYLLATNGAVRGTQKLGRHSKLGTLMIYDDAREDLRGRATRLLSGLA